MHCLLIPSKINNIDNTINTYNIDYPLHVEVGKNIKIVAERTLNISTLKDLNVNEILVTKLGCYQKLK